MVPELVDYQNSRALLIGVAAYQDSWVPPGARRRGTAWPGCGTCSPIRHLEGGRRTGFRVPEPGSSRITRRRPI